MSNRKRWPYIFLLNMENPELHSFDTRRLVNVSDPFSGLVFLSALGLAVNAKQIRYAPTAPNSNSCAMTCLAYAGLPARKPSGSALGHGMRLV